MDKVRIFALGGLEENGKNMIVVEVNDKIFIIEAGLKYPDNVQYGVEYVIPDFNYLIENKKRIVGVFITHAHDDIAGALPELLKQINIPVYTGSYSANVIYLLLKKEGLRNVKINRLPRLSKQMIGGVEVRTFPMTHSLPDNFGIAINTSQGYIVYTGEFVVDYDMLQEEYLTDLNELSDIGKQGVLVLMSESYGIEQQGHTSPRHRITNLIEPLFEKSKTRILITCYAQSLFRMVEIIELAIKKNRKIYIYDVEARALLNLLEEMKYKRFPKEYLLSDSQFNDDLEDVVVIISGNGKNVFRSMTNMADKEDARVHIRPSDTIIIASPIVSGTEIDANNMENEIYKEGGMLYTLDSKKVLSMHPSIEDLKMMIYLFRPKYYVPVKGEYRHLYLNANLGVDMGYTLDRILILENGYAALFENRVLKSVTSIGELNDTLVDGDTQWDVTGQVIKDREILSSDGVMIIGLGIDVKTKKVVNGPDVQTRGLIYLKDAEYIINHVSEISEEIVCNVADRMYFDGSEVRSEIRDAVSRYLIKETGKRPMILPVIIEIRSEEL